MSGKFKGIFDAMEVDRTAGDVPAEGRPIRKRATGKRSDPNYTQITVYVRKSTHQALKETLLLERKGREISELAEELFSNWLQKSGKSKS